MFAVPLTLVVNALPLTPSGLGVGEAAFDQICRWLEPVPSGAAYSTFFSPFESVQRWRAFLAWFPSPSIARRCDQNASNDASAGRDNTASASRPTFRIRSSTER